MQGCLIPNQHPNPLPDFYVTETTTFATHSLQVTPPLRRKCSSQTSVPFARDLATPPVSQSKHQSDRNISEQVPSIWRRLSTDSDGDDKWSTLSSNNGHQMDNDCCNTPSSTPMDERQKSSGSSGEGFEVESTEANTASSCLVGQHTLDTLSTHSIAGSTTSSFERRRDEERVLPARHCTFYLAFSKKRAHVEQKIKEHLERIEQSRKLHRNKRVQEPSNPHRSESSKLPCGSTFSAGIQ